MKFRKKPVVVEAIQYYASMPFYQIAVDFADKPEIFEKQGEVLLIKTLEGVMIASAGDWIIKGYSIERGYHFWPVKPDYFAENYERVE